MSMRMLLIEPKVLMAMVMGKMSPINRENKEVKMFLANCGNENLQYLLVPSRLNHALSVLDKDGDDEIDANEWEDAIAKALQKKLEQRRAMREANAEAAAKAILDLQQHHLSYLF